MNDGSSFSSSDPFDPLGTPKPGSTPSHDAFGAQDPMSSSFAPDPSVQSNAAYPAAAPFPGQNRTLPREEEYEVHPEVHADTSRRDTELILAKLDAIKAELDSLHQRVRKIESVTDQKTGSRKITW